MWRDMLVSKSGFEPRGTGSRRSTTPSHGNMGLRPSSTETLKRVLVVPPTKIMFYYCVVTCFCNPKQKKKGETRPRQSKLPYSNPCVRSFPKRLFIHSSFAMREERYKNFVSIKQKESKRMNEKSGAFTKRAYRESARIARCSFLLLLLARARVRVKRFRASKREENARKKHLSIFSLVVDTKSTNLVRFSSSLLDDESKER